MGLGLQVLVSHLLACPSRSVANDPTPVHCLMTDMVEAKGLTLEQIAEVFDGPGSFTNHAHHQHLSNDDVEARRRSDPFADDVATKGYTEDK